MFNDLLAPVSLHLDNYNLQIILGLLTDNPSKSSYLVGNV